MKVLIFGAALAICMASQLPVSAYYGNNYGNSYGASSYGYGSNSNLSGGSYSGVNSPYMAGYGSGTATTTYMPAANMSQTRYSGGGSATTTYMPYAGMSSTTYRSGY